MNMVIQYGKDSENDKPAVKPTDAWLIIMWWSKEDTKQTLKEITFKENRTAHENVRLSVN